MCRNIRTLHNFEPPATPDEVHAAALQYVRKVSGTTRPSQANQAAFERAVAEVAATTRRLLEELTTHAPPEGPRRRGRQGEGPGRRALRLTDAGRQRAKSTTSSASSFHASTRSTRSATESTTRVGR